MRLNFTFHICRFIVVCLLLKKMKLVRDLVRELSKQIGQSQTIKTAPNAKEILD